MNMAYTYMFVVLLALYTFHILIATSFSGATNVVIPKRTKLPLRLIHRHSISSHFKDFLIGESFSMYHNDDDRRAPLVANKDKSIFLVNISVGEPPAPQLLGMDTGSALTWVRCSYCFWCKYNVFHPEKSSTFNWLKYFSLQCYDFDDGSEHQTDCPFHIKYADDSIVRGLMASDTFTYVTSTGGIEQVPQVAFGCAESTSGSNVADMNGILGLGYRTRNVILQNIGRKFSYCIGSLEDTEYMYNQLILGDGAILQGDSTPFRSNSQGHYKVSLEEISVGEKQLKINQSEFEFNVAMDTGYTTTKLMKSAYEPLVAEIRQLMSEMPPSYRTYPNNPFCYRGDLERDLKGFPTVTLRFAEGAELVLDVDGLFRRTQFLSDFCLSILESKDDNNIIGLVAQQFYNVGYDLEEQRISFQRIDCELLED